MPGFIERHSRSTTSERSISAASLMVELCRCTALPSVLRSGAGLLSWTYVYGPWSVLVVYNGQNLHATVTVRDYCRKLRLCSDRLQRLVAGYTLFLMVG